MALRGCVKAVGSIGLARSSGWLITLAIALAVASLSGCSRQRYASTSAPSPTLDEGGDPPLKPVLSTQDKQQIQSQFRMLAEGHSSSRSPSVAAEGFRWSDIPLAAVYACEETEMAIAHQRETADAYEFDIRTVEGYPAKLEVFRDVGSVYRAQASVGMFDDRTQRADELLRAFERQMRAFGRKRQYRED
jgi:hypothetical protein